MALTVRAAAIQLRVNNRVPSPCASRKNESSSQPHARKRGLHPRRRSRVHPRGNIGGCYPGELVQAAFAWRGRLISYAVLNTYLVCLPFQTCVLAADEVLDDLELEEVESPLSALVKLQCRLQCKHDVLAALNAQLVERQNVIFFGPAMARRLAQAQARLVQRARSLGAEGESYILRTYVRTFATIQTEILRRRAAFARATKIGDSV